MIFFSLFPGKPGKFLLVFFQFPAVYNPGDINDMLRPTGYGQENFLMTQQVSVQSTHNGFNALPNPEKRWFLIRVQELSRAPAHERPALNHLSST
jgi:hypothetical protein